MLQHQRQQSAGRINNQGFSLIEVMVAMAIFAIGILAVFAMMTSAINGNASARMQTEASTLTSDWIERLNALPYDHANLDEGDHAPVTVGAFRVEWNVLGNDPIVNTKTILLTVTCNNPNAKDVRIEFIRGRDI